MTAHDAATILQDRLTEIADSPVLVVLDGECFYRQGKYKLSTMLFRYDMTPLRATFWVADNKQIYLDSTGKQQLTEWGQWLYVTT